ncbi:GSCFA domain-containing protein [Colwelliaceae bacterium 6441]
MVCKNKDNSVDYFEQEQGFEELNKVSQRLFKRKSKIQPSDFTSKLHASFKKVIDKNTCKRIVEGTDESESAIYHPDIINGLLPELLSDDIDSMMCSYFLSEYTLLWFSYTKTEVNKTHKKPLNQWNCDKGPIKQLKMRLILDDLEAQQDCSLFIDKNATIQLKKQGELLGVHQASPTEIDAILEKIGAESEKTKYDKMGVGDVLLFNPNQLGYQHYQSANSTQHVLEFCFIPSPFHWKFTKNNVCYTSPKPIAFDGIAKKILNYTQRDSNHLSEYTFIPPTNKIESPEFLSLLLHNIYSNKVFAKTMFERLMELDPQLKQIHSIDILLETLKMSFRDSTNWQSELNVEDIENLKQLAKFEHEFNDSINRYDEQNKPSSSGIYWPTPNHPSHPSSMYESLPYVKKYPIVDYDTPIGSAGSCFAQEIAKIFQQEGFNYVVTERNDEPWSGLIVDNYKAGDELAIACANYGIIFNSPSFKQLAERAFGIKPTQKLLIQQNDGSWVDPYRENVLFMTHEAYVNDYDKHLNAVKKALEEVEVFIITLGLNECWELRDGSVIARMPRTNRANLYRLIKHKTLTVQENVDNIQQFFDIVKNHNPKLKLVITVSPIPFLATGRADEHHVITANAHSKSVLRVAAEELVKNNDDMYYLPSYEMVTNCIKDPWDKDERHVTKATVKKVVGLFNEIFIKD